MTREMWLIINLISATAPLCREFQKQSGWFVSLTTMCLCLHYISWDVRGRNSPCSLIIYSSLGTLLRPQIHNLIWIPLYSILLRPIMLPFYIFRPMLINLITCFFYRDGSVNVWEILHWPCKVLNICSVYNQVSSSAIFLVVSSSKLVFTFYKQNYSKYISPFMQYPMCSSILSFEAINLYFSN